MITDCKLIPISYWVVALCFSLFFGFKATDIFLTKDQLKDRPSSWKFFQFWLNFVGSIVGWIILWIILPNLIDLMRLTHQNKISLNEIIAMIISFIGITGYLPASVVGLLMSIGDLVSKIGSLTKKQ